MKCCWKGYSSDCSSASKATKRLATVEAGSANTGSIRYTWLICCLTHSKPVVVAAPAVVAALHGSRMQQELSPGAEVLAISQEM